MDQTWKQMEEQNYQPSTEGNIITSLLTISLYLDLMKQYNEILYKTSAKEVGKTAHMAEKKTSFGHNGKFSKVTD